MLTCADFPEVKCCEICHSWPKLPIAKPGYHVCCEVAFRIENPQWTPPKSDDDTTPCLYFPREKVLT